jgi:PAS domain S-box-containing protein
MKIRNKILLCFLTPGLLIGSLAVGIGYHSIRKVVERNIYDQLEIAADELRTHIGLFLDGKRNRLIDFSSDGFIRDCTERIIDGISGDVNAAQLNSHLINNKKPLDTDILEVFIVDLEGKVISSTEINRVGKDVSGEPYFSKTIRVDSFINDLHYSTEFSENTYEVSRLLVSRDGEKTIGIIVNRYNGDSFMKVTRSGFSEELGKVKMLEGLGETGELYIVNSDKLMVTESRFIKGAVLKQVVDTEGVRAAFENGTGMVGIYPDYRGVPIVGVSRYFEDMDWVVVAEKDVSEAFVPAVRIRNFAIIMGTTGIIVLVIMTVLIAKGITRPIHKLVTSTNTIAQGNLTEEINHESNDEIGDLAGSFDAMRIKLGILLKNIEEGKKEWESTFDSVRDIIILWGKDCRLIRCNQALLDNLDVKFEDIAGKNCREIFPQIKKEDLSKCSVIETVKTLKPVTSEIEIPCLNGFFSVSNFPRFDTNGEFAGAVQIMNDITERKRAEERIKALNVSLEKRVVERTAELVKLNEKLLMKIDENKKKEDKLHVANEEWERSFNALSAHICILDMSGAILRYNKSMREHFEQIHGNLTGLDYRLVYCGTATPDPQPPCAAVLSGAPDVSVETTLPMMDGWYRVSSYPIFDSYGKQCGAVSVVEDITKQKQSEVALIKARDQAEAANRSKSEFLANMSHELRTPLNSVIGFSEILMDKSFGEINEKQEKYLSNIHKSGKHLLEMINDIIDLSRVDSGRMALELKKLSLPQTLNDAVAAMKPAAGKKNIEIKTYIDEKLSTINADEVKLRKIINILLDNAVKFTPDGGKIRVEAKVILDLSLNPKSEIRNPKCVEISVTDTGIGVKSEDQERIFKGFEQADGSYTRKHKGTGLGLALAGKFVKMHGGKTWVESPPGKGMALEADKGSSFIFIIPCKPVQPDAGIIDPATRLLTWEYFFRHIERILLLHKRINHQFGLLCLKLEDGKKKLEALSFAEVLKDVIRKYEIFTHDKDKKYYYTVLLDIDREKADHAAMRISEALKESGYAANIKTVIYPEDGDSVDALLKALSG